MSTPAPTRRFPWWIYGLTLALIAGFTLWPYASVLLAENMISTHGCRLDEGHIQPCMINGKDEGVLVYNMAMTGWYILLTFPVGFCLAMVWLIVLLVHRSSWKKAGTP
jgi:hypothetical protein